MNISAMVRHMCSCVEGCHKVVAVPTNVSHNENSNHTQKPATRSWLCPQTFHMNESSKHTQRLIPLLLGTQQAAACWTCLQGSHKQRFASRDGKLPPKHCKPSHIRNQLWSGPTTSLCVSSREFVVGRLQYDPFFPNKFHQNTYKLFAHATQVLRLQCCLKALLGVVTPRLVLMRLDIFRKPLHQGNNVLLLRKKVFSGLVHPNAQA